jgi:uncharacterized membrane protein YeaQ/YmgE (transglycosylase-associated protein family)
MAIGFGLVVSILANVTFFVWLMTRLEIDKLDFSIGAFGTIALGFVGALVAVKIFS